MALTKDQIRARMMNFGKKVVDFEGVLPGLEDLAGELAIRELSAADTSAISGVATTENGYDNALDIGATIARGLISKATGERVFSDTDAQTISEFGLSVLSPLINKIKEISGLSATAVQDTKKNSLSQPPASGSVLPTNSIETSEQPAQDAQLDSFSATSQTPTI